jgi:hypothetical protein
MRFTYLFFVSLLPKEVFTFVPNSLSLHTNGGLFEKKSLSSDDVQKIVSSFGVLKARRNATQPAPRKNVRLEASSDDSDNESEGKGNKSFPAQPKPAPTVKGTKVQSSSALSNEIRKRFIESLPVGKDPAVDLNAVFDLVKINKEIWDRCKNSMVERENVQVMRLSYEEVEASTIEDGSFAITTQTSLSKKAFGNPPMIPIEIGTIFLIEPDDSVFPDYIGFLNCAALLDDNVARPFFSVLLNHLLEVNAWLNDIEEWLLEPGTYVTFLNDLFGANLTPKFDDDNVEILFTTVSSPGNMDLTFDICTKEGREELENFYTFAQQFGKWMPKAKGGK